MIGDIGFFLTLAFALVIGIRHGIDFDHIAAIADITSSQIVRSRGLIFSLLYSLGHGTMVMLIGILIIFFGKSLPSWFDKMFENIVGVTLILLGIYVVFSVFKQGSNYVFKSRWMLIFSAIKYGYHKLLHNFNLSHRHPKLNEEKYQPQTAFGIGLLHGIGAETPTQIAAMGILMGIKGEVKSFLFLAFFISGILISNMIMAFLISFSHYKAKQSKNLFVLMGLITALFSLAVGIIFIIS